MPIPGKKPAEIALTPTPPIDNYHFFNEKYRVSIKE
jgi:hypothetical protein